ncbi:mannose-6-phosphate isomerase, type 1 [Caloramator fervidus]|uniref:Phosphohexomutase n=1 Tax=Caloramator fervidus TaxID=29344 RepID=A0A1H5U9L5_9CLOT|nr:type I phosphomannose isomerase catalytic subunit [Caloramator fervidus]SEF71098.1 mannose-6-phosphate isomerase, type 1 [Caloramator fervidus]
MLYPLFFQPIYKSTIWGGRKLESYFKRQIPDGNIAESWDISCHKKGMSIIKNGNLKGKTLEEAIKIYKKEILGDKHEYFPLLVKLIDANDKLSVQVHPDDEYAKKIENQFGKTEMWYVIDAKKDAKIIYGLKKGTTKENFKKAILKGNVEDFLNFVNVEKGDVIFIPSGTVHAILDELLLLEIQQNSDVTYRIYDWNRVDKDGKKRELHLDKALDVINYNFEGKVIKPKFKDFQNFKKAKAVCSKYFNVEIIKIEKEFKDVTRNSFIIFTAVEGEGKLIKNEEYQIKAGDSFLIPACLCDFKIEGNLTVLKTTV